MEKLKNTIFIDLDNVNLHKKKLLSDYPGNGIVYKIKKYSEDIIDNYNSSNVSSKYSSLDNNYYFDLLKYEISELLVNLGISNSEENFTIFYRDIENKIGDFFKKHMKINSFYFSDDIKEYMLNYFLNNSNDDLINFFNNNFLQELLKLTQNIDLVNLPIIESDTILINDSDHLANGVIYAYYYNDKIKFRYEYINATAKKSLNNSTINKEIVKCKKNTTRKKINKAYERIQDLENFIDFLKIHINEKFISIFDKEIYDIIDRINKFFDEFDFELKIYKKDFYYKYMVDLMYYINHYKINGSLYAFNEEFIKDKPENYKNIQSDTNFYKYLQNNIILILDNIILILDNIIKDIENNRYITKGKSDKERISRKENREKTILKKEELINFGEIIHTFIKVINVNSDKNINEIKQEGVFSSFDEMIELFEKNMIFSNNVYSGYFRELLNFYIRNNTLTLDDYNNVYQGKLQKIIKNFPENETDNDNYVVIKTISEQFKDKAKFNFDLLLSLDSDINTEIEKLNNIIN